MYNGSATAVSCTQAVCHLYGLGTFSAIFCPEMASEAILGLLISLKLVRAYATAWVSCYTHQILGPVPEIARYQMNMPIISSAREATVATHSWTKLHAQIMS